MAKPLSVRPSYGWPHFECQRKNVADRLEIGRRLFCEAPKSKRLSSGQNVVDSLNDGKRCLLAVSNCNLVSGCHREIKIGFVPFADILPATPLCSLSRTI